MKKLKAEKPRFKVSPEFVAHARAGGKNVNRNPFAPADPPPFVLPKGGQKLAQDSALSSYGGWAGSSFGGIVSEGLTFMGYPYLAELAQRPEYRVIVETIAGEMTRKWIKFKAGGDEADKSEKIKAIETEFRRLRVREHFRTAEEKDGFFGRGHIYIDVGQAEDDPNEVTQDIGDGWNSVSRAKVSKGTQIRLQVIEPLWVYASRYNSTNPLKSDWYKPQVWYVMGRPVHCSRVLTFVAREVPDLLKPAYSFGGLSLSQMAKPYVDNWIRTRQSVADIVYKFSTNVLKTQMGDALTGGAGTDVNCRVSAFVALQNNSGVLLLDKDSEEFVNVSAPIAGLDHLQAQTQEHMAAVARIPLVKLLGITPSGLNASADGEVRVFYDFIHDSQESHFREPIHALLGLVQLSLFGELDEEIEFEFLPLEELNEKERADLRKVEADTDNVLVELGAISPEEVRHRVASDPDTPYAGLDVDAMPEQSTPEQWQEALTGLAETPEGATPDQYAEAFGLHEGGATPAEASPEKWATALGAEPEPVIAPAKPAHWAKALGVAVE